MMNTHSIVMEQQNRGDQLHLLKSYSRFLKLRKSGFPFSDARNMTGLNDDNAFEKAQEIYKNYL
ncbi:hypothetical protein [Nafulsella turpanensis]|uniref:hypothetical protein n=1 Tax=Nafulsella turpanensis TaxID=1265690 RepID=UPI00068783E1|nr:hypothetical protein [Nafulsella turpanensis]